MRTRKANKILREIEPENHQRLLKESQRALHTQLLAIIGQLKQQAYSTYGDGAPWGKAGLEGFGDDLTDCGESLIVLGQSFNSGKPPQWHVDQQAAYEKAAIGQLHSRAPGTAAGSSNTREI